MINDIPLYCCSEEIVSLLRSKGADVTRFGRLVNGKDKDRISCTDENAIEWLRLNFNIHISIKHLPFCQKYSYEITGNYDPKNRGYLQNYYFTHYDSIHEARQEALLYTLKNLI